MPHVRAQIRDAVKVLLTGLATTGTRVHVGRTRQLGEAFEPTLLIYTRNVPERSETHSLAAAATQHREFTLSIEGRVSAANPPDETLDEIASEIETALTPAGALPASLAALLLIEVTLAETASEVIAPGERHLGSIRLDYRIVYRTAEGAPDTAV